MGGINKGRFVPNSTSQNPAYIHKVDDSNENKQNAADTSCCVRMLLLDGLISNLLAWKPILLSTPSGLYPQLDPKITSTAVALTALPLSGRHLPLRLRPRHCPGGISRSLLTLRSCLQCIASQETKRLWIFLALPTAWEKYA